MHEAVPATHQHFARGADWPLWHPKEVAYMAHVKTMKNSDLGTICRANDVSRGASEKGEGCLG
jgi:hypothetical protein